MPARQNPNGRLIQSTPTAVNHNVRVATSLVRFACNGKMPRRNADFQPVDPGLGGQAAERHQLGWTRCLNRLEEVGSSRCYRRSMDSTRTTGPNMQYVPTLAGAITARTLSPRTRRSLGNPSGS